MLATAFAPKDKGGTNENEPMLMTISYGRGRVFFTALGHDVEQMRSVAFIATFQRGAEWAASGKVTQAVPDDFPTADKPSVRPLTRGKASRPPVVYRGGEGPGKGKHIVLISGDEEYRSEEAMPQLGKILAEHHGFKCTVLFAINPTTGKVDPTALNNIPGLEALKTADLMIIFTRFRNLPDDQMRNIVDYIEAGKPILGIRTATHAFDIPLGKTYAKYSWQSKQWDGGFGRQILGETWIKHYGWHGKESTRGVIAPGLENNPIVRGCDDIWVPTDVYCVRTPLPGDSKPLVLGQVLTGMNATDKPVPDARNHPMLPIAWTKTYQGRPGPDRPRVHHHHGLRRGSVGRGLSPFAGQRDLLVRGSRREDSPTGQRRTCRRLQTIALGFLQAPGAGQIGRQSRAIIELHGSCRPRKGVGAAVEMPPQLDLNCPAHGEAINASRTACRGGRRGDRTSSVLSCGRRGSTGRNRGARRRVARPTSSAPGRCPACRRRPGR